jgi:hypothetical protein
MKGCPNSEKKLVHSRDMDTLFRGVLQVGADGLSCMLRHVHADLGDIHVAFQRNEVNLTYQSNLVKFHL